MSQDNQFQQYGYDQFLKAPKKQRIGGGSSMWEGVSEKLRSPVVATVALLAAGALFTGVIIMAYPSGKSEDAEIPIIKADLTPMKSEPSEPGGMDVPYSDNTMLSSIGQDKQPEDMNHIENLLSQANQDLGSKEEALQRAVGEDISQQARVEEEPVPQERGMYLESDSTQSQQPALVQAESSAASLEASQGAQVQASAEIETPDPSGLLQKIDPAKSGQIDEEGSQRLAQAAAAEKPKLHAAATSPETIDYVRSALKEGGSDVSAQESSSVEKQAMVKEVPSSEESETEAGYASSVNAGKQAKEEMDASFEQSNVESERVAEPSEVEPAAGVASPAIKIKAGEYYVQLSSITDRSLADKEFSKLQKKFSVLSGLKYRVEEANLDKGTFYRIQAGPFSKDSAKSICDSIKSQKPGGCILVK